MNKILLIEDDIWLSDMYGDSLKANGIMVAEARSAESGLDVLDSNQDIDIVILDMFLPAHSGVEFLHELASHSDINSLPVIILSSVSKRDFGMSDERWLHYGVIDYLYKPETKPGDLTVAVKKHLASLGVAKK